MFTSGKYRELIPLGLALNKDIDWISYHGGYDFAYLYKLVTCDELPEAEEEYKKQLAIYFPNYYDVKELLKDIQSSSGSLSKAADNLGVLLP
jgi:CCR4-NOT transcription complex subunit 7/8